jgi:hypothetical protein
MTEQLNPRPPFKVSGLATIRHLNVRKEGPEDEKILAVDVKLEIKNVDRRLCGYFDEALEAFLWRGETDALIARNSFLTPVRYVNEIREASVSIGNNSYSGCDVKKFELSPCDGGVITLTCSISVYPNSADVSDLAKMVQDEAMVSIEGPPDLFAGEPNLSVDMGGNVITSMTGTTECSEIDPMYQGAVELVLKTGKASISLVQRHLKIGYNRAARLIEDMEKAGLVSPMSPSGERVLLIEKNHAPSTSNYAL